METGSISKRLHDWWRHDAGATWVKAALLASSCLSIVAIAVSQAVAFFDRYWPKQDPLTVAEVFQVGQLTVLTLGLASIVLLWRQGRDAAQWRRLLTYHEFFDDLPDPAAREAMIWTLNSVKASGALMGMGAPLTKVQVLLLNCTVEKHQSIKRYLDGFEQLCGAVNCRVIDEEYTRDLEGARVVRIWRIFEPFIRQEQKANARIYVEFEKVASRWEKLRVEEDQAHADEELKAQARKIGRRLNRGVRPAAP